MEVQNRIQQFIQSNFNLARGPMSINIDTPLLESGIIDSTGVTELVMFVEEEFGVMVVPEDIVPENFNSIASLAVFVQSRIGPRQAAAAS